MSSVTLPKVISFGGSGDARSGGFGQGAMVVKDGITPEAAVPGDGAWNSQALRLTGKYLKSDAPEIFTYDGTTCTANVHLWVTVICDCQITDETATKKFLGFIFTTARFGVEYKSKSAFVEGCATTVFADEFYPGDTLSVGINSDTETQTVDGDFIFAASPLPI